MTITMYDSVDVSQIPVTAEAVAGYVGGTWKTFPVLVQRFPHAHRLSIAVNASEDADCLDVESGDATPADCPAWYHRQKQRTPATKPVFYCDTSTAPAVVDALISAGIYRGWYRLWTAHYTNAPHIETGSDATQWSNKALGRNLDISWCRDSFFADPDTWQPGDEVNWCKEWDRIVGKRPVRYRLRRLYLRGQMLLRRRAITVAAHKSGWNRLNRLYRYEQLQNRTR